VTVGYTFNGQLALFGKPSQCASRHGAIRKTESGGYRKADRGIVGKWSIKGVGGIETHD
jgi:hypothetical protein